MAFFIYTAFFKPAPEPVSKKQKEAATSTPAGSLPEAEPGEGVTVEDEKEKEEDRLITGDIEGPDKKRKEVDDKARGGLTKTYDLNDSPSLAPSLNRDGSGVRYYDRVDQRFYKIDEDGNKTLMSEKEFYSVENVNWSPADNKAVIEYPDGSNIVYDFDRKEQVTLPKHWEDFDFSRDGNNIVMKSMGNNPGNRWLAVSNPDGSRARPIEEIGDNDDDVYPSWSPNDQTIAMHTQGVDFNRQELFFVGKNNENFRSTIIEGRGFQPKWSPRGDKLIYSVYSTENELKPKLWAVNAQGESIGTDRKTLGVETWAEKCAFRDNNELYCAVPDELPKGAGMFSELRKNTKDTLYKIDVETGLKKIVAVPDETFNMSDLMISGDGDNLYFRDHKNETLHKIELE